MIIRANPAIQRRDPLGRSTATIRELLSSDKVGHAAKKASSGLPVRPHCGDLQMGMLRRGSVAVLGYLWPLGVAGKSPTPGAS
jgi:hypothetical protein